MDNQSTQRGFLAYAVFTLTVLIAAGLGYVAYRLGAGELYFGRAIAAAAQNRGNPAYENLNRAIRQNPFNGGYRVSYSQLNLGIAVNIANRSRQTSDVESQLSEAERRTIQQLVEQSIREAKNAVALNPISAGNWQNLAVIYRNLVNVAAGADQWAVATYRQSIALNPNDPSLRLNYGQFLYSFNEFEAAQRQFEAAANLKPDLANAHFNLAAALRQQEKYQQARFRLQQALNLLELGTQDYETVQEELDIVSQLAEAEATEGGQQFPLAGEEATTSADTAGAGGEQPPLSSPAEATSGAQLEPPLELEEESAPPRLTPQPTATLTPTP